MFSGPITRAWAGDCPRDFLFNLKLRATQIIALELLALCVTLHWAREELRNRPAIIFVENLGVACMVAKGATGESDLQPLVTGIPVLLASANCKLRIKYVPSACNPADEPSRSGMSVFAAVETPYMPAWAWPYLDLSFVVKAAQRTVFKQQNRNWIITPCLEPPPEKTQGFFFFFPH